MRNYINVTCISHWLRRQGKIPGSFTNQFWHPRISTISGTWRAFAVKATLSLIKIYLTDCGLMPKILRVIVMCLIKQSSLYKHALFFMVIHLRTRFRKNNNQKYHLFGIHITLWRIINSCVEAYQYSSVFCFCFF